MPGREEFSFRVPNHTGIYTERFGMLQQDIEPCPHHSGIVSQGVHRYNSSFIYLGTPRFQPTYPSEHHLAILALFPRLNEIGSCIFTSRMMRGTVSQASESDSACDASVATRWFLFARTIENIREHIRRKQQGNALARVIRSANFLTI